MKVRRRWFAVAMATVVGFVCLQGASAEVLPYGLKIDKVLDSTAEVGDLVQGPRLLEEMAGTVHDGQLLGAPHGGVDGTVEVEHRRVQAPDDQQRRRRQP